DLTAPFSPRSPPPQPPAVACGPHCHVLGGGAASHEGSWSDDDKLMLQIAFPIFDYS
ncbi:unnamed protein product, partial [Closterium sp. Naga37s-1]